MFQAKTPKIQQLAEMYSDRIQELDLIFEDKTNIYIDWANVWGRQNKLGRHIDLKRLYQFLRSFTNIDKIRWYYGTLIGDSKSETEIAKVRSFGYDVNTKPVKIMKHSVDIASMKNFESSSVLQSFLTRGLLNHLDIKTIETFNKSLHENLNKKGVFYIEERKCNFDVEIGVDMILDYERSITHNLYKIYILRSGDSDFTDIVTKMIDQGKKVFVFATNQRISKELSESGAIIFDIQKIRDFICRSREIRVQTQKELFD